MEQDQIIILLIILLALVLFVWEKWRYDVVALGAMLFGVFLGVIPANDAFSGFGHPAVITVAAVLILSKALANSGVTDLIVSTLAPLTGNFYLYLFGLCFVAMVLSAFMNNVGALALLMPVAIATSTKVGRSPSLILMPLAFASLLGGLVTLIGTPPNIIISTFREQSLGEPFSMFDFTPVGGIVALGGLFFICLVGWHLIPKTRVVKRPLQDLLDIKSYVTEIQFNTDSSLINTRHSHLEELAEKASIEILGLIRHAQRFVVIPKNQVYQDGDILIINADPTDLDRFCAKYSFTIKGSDDSQKTEKNRDKILPFGSEKEKEDMELIEVVVGSNSDANSRQIGEIGFRRRYGINLLGVSRQGHSYKGSLKAFALKVGDVLLLRGTTERLEAIISTLGFMPLAERRLKLGGHKNLYKSISIFAFAVGLTTLKIFPAPVAMSVGALLMVLTKTLNLKDFYDSIDWPIIILLGAMIPISMAFEYTGAANFLVKLFIGESPTLSPLFLLTTILILTMFLTDIMNNAATAIIMAPIAVSIAQSLEVNPDSFLMAVAIGASSSFLTPIGHQNNALILGPGGYKFSDYWRMGLPLEIIITLISIPMILIVWPLQP
ncbi:MAG: SLC13 family permease [Alphaproteobacteria bacterium]|nr:SLC13 family permease [Alphaproteobacteria bacterium]